MVAPRDLDLTFVQKSFDSDDLFEDSDDLFDSDDAIRKALGSGQQGQDTGCDLAKKMIKARSLRTKSGGMDLPGSTLCDKVQSEIISLGGDERRGDEPRDEHDEQTLMEAFGRSCRWRRSEGGRNASSPGKTVDAIIRSFQDQQEQFSNQTALFVKEQRERLEEHMEAIELLLLKQRSELEQTRVLVECDSPQTAVSKQLSEAGTARTQVKVSFKTTDRAAPSADAGFNWMMSGQRSPRARGLTRPTISEFYNRTTNSIHREETEARAWRVHEAYQRAAQKMHQKSAFARFQECLLTTHAVSPRRLFC